MNKKNQHNEIFPSSMAGYRWLRETGWKISLEPFWRHGHDGKWVREADGKTVKKAVLLAYAEKHLKRVTMEDANVKDLQQEKLEAEAKKLKAQAEHWRIKTEVEKGNLVPREEFERALARRALVFKNDLLAFARGQAPVIVRLVNGQNEKASELIEFFTEQLEDLLGRYVEKS